MPTLQISMRFASHMQASCAHNRVLLPRAAKSMVCLLQRSMTQTRILLVGAVHGRSGMCARAGTFPRPRIDQGSWLYQLKDYLYDKRISACKDKDLQKDPVNWPNIKQCHPQNVFIETKSKSTGRMHAAGWIVYEQR